MFDSILDQHTVFLMVQLLVLCLEGVHISYDKLSILDRLNIWNKLCILVHINVKTRRVVRLFVQFDKAVHDIR
jgi:hypothetical protein